VDAGANGKHAAKWPAAYDAPGGAAAHKRVCHCWLGKNAPEPHRGRRVSLRAQIDGVKRPWFGLGLKSTSSIVNMRGRRGGREIWKRCLKRLAQSPNHAINPHCAEKRCQNGRAEKNICSKHGDGHQRRRPRHRRGGGVRAVGACGISDWYRQKKRVAKADE
jgi:hypothetical protein